MLILLGMLNMNCLKSIILGLLYFLPIVVFAQNEWTLEMCIEHAVSNNLTIRQSGLQKHLSHQLLQISKTKFLPTVNANFNTGNNWGKNFDSNTFLFTDEKTSSSGVSLSSSFDIFNGLNKYLELSKNKQSYTLSKFSHQKAINDISIQIASAYIKILFDIEILDNTEKQLQVTGLQLERTKKLVDAGNLPMGDMYNLQAQMASEELAVIESQNQLESDQLNLMQILDIPSNEPISIIKPDIDQIIAEEYPLTIDWIYNEAKDSLPEIKIAELNLKVAKLEQMIIKGSYLPSVTGSGYIRSSSSSSFDEEYKTQLDNNRRDYIGISLNIPVFNNFQNYERETAARYEVRQKEFDLEKVHQDLYKTIQKAFQEMKAAYKKLNAATKQKNAMEEAFKYAQQKFNMGVINTVEFTDTKNKFRKAESDLFQAKFDYIFKLKVLDFYRGKKLNFN